MVRLLALAAALLFASHPAWAHTEIGVPGGLLSGFLHPLTGIDHAIAMISVGLWGALLGAPAIWVLPITFPLVMAIGGVLGIMNVPVPQPEVMIALSALVLGGVVAFRVQVPLWIAGLVVSLFAIFHGYAHGQELPEAANPLAYGIGFVVATGMLHTIGIGIGVLTRWRTGLVAIRVMGVVVAASGAVFLQAALG